VKPEAGSDDYVTELLEKLERYDHRIKEYTMDNYTKSDSGSVVVEYKEQGGVKVISKGYIQEYLRRQPVVAADASEPPAEVPGASFAEMLEKMYEEVMTDGQGLQQGPRTVTDVPVSSWFISMFNKDTLDNNIPTKAPPSIKRPAKLKKSGFSLNIGDKVITPDGNDAVIEYYNEKKEEVTVNVGGSQVIFRCNQIQKALKVGDMVITPEGSGEIVNTEPSDKFKVKSHRSKREDRIFDASDVKRLYYKGDKVVATHDLPGLAKGQIAEIHRVRDLEDGTREYDLWVPGTKTLHPALVGQMTMMYMPGENIEHLRSEGYWSACHVVGVEPGKSVKIELFGIPYGKERFRKIPFEDAQQVLRRGKS